MLVIGVMKKCSCINVSGSKKQTEQMRGEGRGLLMIGIGITKGEMDGTDKHYRGGQLMVGYCISQL